MRQVAEFLVKVVLFAFVWCIWWWALNTSLSNTVNLSIIVGGILLVFPVVWLGRKTLDKKPTINRSHWVTTFVHYAVGPCSVPPLFEP